jgi:hypothetical protein
MLNVNPSIMDERALVKNESLTWPLREREN